MPYSVGLLFRDGKPLVYASGDFPKSQQRALALLELRELSRAPEQRARARALSRHRHRQLRRGDGARAVRGRDRARAAQRQGRGRDRRHIARTGHAHDTVADRGRPGRLPHGGYRDDRGRHRGDLAGRGRVRQPAGDQCRLVRADGRATRAQARSSRWPRACSAWRRATSTSRMAAPPARGGNKPSHRRSASSRARPGHAGILVCRRPGAGPRAHRLFHAAAGVLLQRHACRRGRRSIPSPAA